MEYQDKEFREGELKRFYVNQTERLDMHKRLKFAPELIPLILSREKVSTWRLWDDKELVSGDTVIFIDSKTEKKFAIATITKVFEKPLGEVTAEDKKGHEIFTSDEEMYMTYTKYYERLVDKDTNVKIVCFELI